ncbi:MAG: hypothetical protein MUD08_11840 [Cytophagales bacterium]|jgi:hypothetical protein|nr:hypothetical protein [Cytophagales bacterium]
MKSLPLTSILFASALLITTACSITEEPAPADVIPNGITYTTTNFSDGWVATVQAEYVQVTKDGIEVRLYYPDQNLDNNRPPNTSIFEPYYWDARVKPDYNTGQVFVREKEAYSFGKNDMLEAAATDKKSGKSGYLGMTYRSLNGGGWVITAFTPDRDTYYRLCPNWDAFVQFINYNQFAVAAADLVGQWGGGDATAFEYYNAAGSYVGFGASAVNNEFTFRSSGKYENRNTVFLNGVQTETNYSGNFSTDQWTLTLTNRDDAGEYACAFNAYKGGFILRLTNKQFTGLTYTLSRKRE